MRSFFTTGQVSWTPEEMGKRLCKKETEMILKKFE
jgi:hypothetical protein